MSTLTEQIAAVKRVIDECGANGYDDFQDDPHTFGHMTAMRSVLATLEGMAAPEEIHDLDAWIDEEARLAGQMMRDSPPQQPTQEASRFVEGWHWPNHIRHEDVARCLDAFAAQSVTAAEQELEQVTAANARWAAKCRNMFVEIERLTAATDKARREAIDECALWHDQQSLTCKPWARDDNLLRRAHTDAAAAIRALTPQNPGDAAPHQEGENG